MGSNSNTRSNSIVEFGFTDDRELENGGSNSLMAGSWAAKVRGDKGAEGDIYSPTASVSAMDTHFPPPSATAAVVGPKLNGNGPAHVEISATGVDSNGVFHPQSQRLQQQHQQQQEQQQQQQHYNHLQPPPQQQQQQAHHYQGGYIGMVHNGSDMSGLMPIGAHHDHHPHHLFDPHQQHQAFLDPNMALGMVPHHMMGGLPMLAPPGVGGLAIEGGEPLGALGGMGGMGGGLEIDGGGGHDYGGGNGGAHAAAAVALTGDGFENSKEYTLGLFPCVRLSGLAATTSVNDVMMFFTGLGPVLDIVLDPARSGGGGDSGGEQTLDAVVLFGNMMDYHGALQRYSLQLLGRYVEVAPALRGDYYAAIMQRDACAAAAAAQQQQPPPPPAAEPDAHLLLSEALPSVEMPASASAAQPPAAVAVGDDAGTPVAVPADSSAAHDDDNVEQQPAAPSPQDASQAASAAAAGGAPSVVANGGSAGGEAAATPTAAAAAGAVVGAAPTAGAKAAAAGAAAAAPGGADAGGKGAVMVIRMRGLPYRASKADVMAFFQGCAVAEVNFVARADGRVTGEAYVKFASREDARQGLRRDRDMIGNRYIELFTSSPEEMARYLKRHS